MITEHSKTFGFSSANRWVHCNGSIKLAENDPPEPSTEESREGDAAHYVAEQGLLSFKADISYLNTLNGLIDTQDPAGTIITEEMVDAALVYVKTIVAIVGNDPERRKALFVEMRVNSNYMDPEAWGTADAIFYDPLTNTLYVWDFKYGHGSVLAYENYQLIGYAQAACENLNLTRLNPRLDLNIIQPRCYDGNGPIRNWVIAFDFIRTYINKMKFAIQQYRMAKPLLVSGSWCTNCQVSWKCPSVTNAAAIGIDQSNKTFALEMTAEGLAYEKQLIDTALARMTERSRAIDVMVEGRIRKGELIPGYRMMDAFGRKAWSCAKEQVLLMGKAFKLDFKKPDDVITPTQAIALLKKNGLPADAIKSFHHSPKAGVKLVADDGTRAKLIFSEGKL